MSLHDRTAALLAHLRENTPAGEPFVYPGQRGEAERKRNLVEGVPLHLEIVEQLSAAGVTL